MCILISFKSLEEYSLVKELTNLYFLNNFKYLVYFSIKVVTIIFFNYLSI